MFSCPGIMWWVWPKELCKDDLSVCLSVTHTHTRRALEKLLEWLEPWPQPRAIKWFVWECVCVCERSVLAGGVVGEAQSSVRWLIPRQRRSPRQCYSLYFFQIQQSKSCGTLSHGNLLCLRLCVCVYLCVCRSVCTFVCVFAVWRGLKRNIVASRQSNG